MIWCPHFFSYTHASSFSSRKVCNNLNIITRYSNVRESHDLRFSASGTDVIFGYTSRNPILTLLLMTAIELHRVYTRLMATFSITCGKSCQQHQNFMASFDPSSEKPRSSLLPLKSQGTKHRRNMSHAGSILDTKSERGLRRAGSPGTPWPTLQVAIDPLTTQENVYKEFLVFQFVPIASHPTTGNHWKKPGSIFLGPSFQVFVQMDEIPLSLLFSRLNSPLSQSFSQERSSSLLIFMVPSLDGLQHVHVSLVLGSPALAPELQMCLTSAEQRWKIPSLDLLAARCLVQSRRLVALLATRAHCWLIFMLFP